MFGSVVPQEMQIDNYTLFKRNRHVSYNTLPQMANQKGGGVAIFAKNHLNVQVLQYLLGVTNLEYVAVKINNPIKTVVAAVYRPPTYNKSEFLTNMKNLLDAVEIQNPGQIVICGDMNEDTATNAKPIHKFFTDRGYTQLIQTTTTQKHTTLDLIYVSHPQKCLSAGVLHSYYSYHQPVYTVVQND